MYKKDDEKFKNIAEERVEILFELARKNISDEETARDYVKAAIRIAKFCNLRLGKKKALFCKKCCTFFNSENSKVRLNPRKKKVEILCLNCGYKRFYGYRRKRRKETIRNNN